MVKDSEHHRSSVVRKVDEVGTSSRYGINSRVSADLVAIAPLRDYQTSEYSPLYMLRLQRTECEFGVLVRTYSDEYNPIL
jgi:hypothetical protein